MAFQCRGRKMTNLSEPQRELAFDGRIRKELRRESPVYYWQTTKQASSLCWQAFAAIKIRRRFTQAAQL
eukprot:4236849-Pleurochrysis_carterae.AAC.5